MSCAPTSFGDLLGATALAGLALVR